MSGSRRRSRGRPTQPSVSRSGRARASSGARRERPRVCQRRKRASRTERPRAPSGCPEGGRSHTCRTPADRCDGSRAPRGLGLCRTRATCFRYRSRRPPVAAPWFPHPSPRGWLGVCRRPPTCESALTRPRRDRARGACKARRGRIVGPSESRSLDRSGGSAAEGWISVASSLVRGTRYDSSLRCMSIKTSASWGEGPPG